MIPLYFSNIDDGFFLVFSVWVADCCLPLLLEIVMDASVLVGTVLAVVRTLTQK